MADALVSGLNTLTTAQTDHAADFAVIYDDSEDELKRQTVREMKNEQGPAAGSSNVVQKPHLNTCDTAAAASTIAGGGDTGTSTVDASYLSKRNAIGENGINIFGTEDQAGYTAGDADFATISGGSDNFNNCLAGTIAGGSHNALGYLSTHGVIGGGSQNAIIRATDYATIAGGTQNRIGETAAADKATIGGGQENRITQGNNNTVGGGVDNDITGTGGTATIGGGSANVISSSGAHNTIAGGSLNTISGTALGAVIAGGAGNTVSANYGFCGAGNANTVSGTYAGAFGSNNTSTGDNSLTVGDRVSGHIAGGLHFGARNFGNVVGSAQGNSFVLARQSTGGAAAGNVNLTVFGTSTYPIPPDDSVWTGTIHLTGKVEGTMSLVSYRWRFVVSKAAGADIVVEYEEARTADVSDFSPAQVPAIRTGSGINYFTIFLRGVDATTINWVARVDLAHVMDAA